MNEIDAAAVCKALGDPNRLRIAHMLSGGEMCACRLLEAFDVTQPTLSHHMKILCGCGLVIARREGKWSRYSLNGETLAAFREHIGSLGCPGDEGGDGCK